MRSSRPARPRSARLVPLFIFSVALAISACEGAGPSQVVPGGDPEIGHQRIASYGCGACHTIPSVTGANGKVGPSLAGFADRRFIAGAIPNEPDNLVRWIQDAPSLAPGTIMPKLDVPDPDARHIAAFLYTLH